MTKRTTTRRVRERTLGWWMSLVAGLAAVGCGGFALTPVTPASTPSSALRAGPISSIGVGVDPAIDGDKLTILEKYAIPTEIETNLVASFSATGQYDPTVRGIDVRVTITQFRLGRYDAARMHTEVVVTDGAGRVARTYETESDSMAMTSRTNRLQRITQDTIQRVADGV